MEATLDQISPLLPIDFFRVEVDLHEIEKKGWSDKLKKRYELPDISPLLYEDSFSKMAMGWHAQGLVFDVSIARPFQECIFPLYRKGDSIELFIDTRDLKSAGSVTRFCHHFVIYPQPIDGIHAQEVTHFRGDDRHVLCESDQIKVTTDLLQRRLHLKIFIPSECLHGYDPTVFDKLGFAYRINRVGGQPDHFGVSSKYLAIEQQPSLWSTMHLRKK